MDIKELVLEHTSGPNYCSALATGITIAGPSADGMVHLTFFREVMRPTSETFKMLPAGPPAPADAVTLERIATQAPRMYREDVATISLPMATVETLRDIINQNIAARAV